MLNREFSVFMSLYGKERAENLESCFLSLKQQTQLPTEIVLVIDGPISERLEDIVRRWEMIMPVKRVVLASNLGLGLALAEGMKQCSYEYIARMDTDDICLPERFQRQILFLHNNPDVALLGTAIREFSETGEERLKLLPEYHAEIKAFARLKNPFNHMSVMFKRSVVEAVGGYHHHLYMEDYNLWLRMIAANYKTHNLPEILLNVRAGNSMLKKRRGWNYMKSEFDLFKLKKRLGLLSPLSNLVFFMVRVSTRVAPEHILSLLYRIDRAKI